MFEITETALLYPPNCPVYICDGDEFPPGIDAQGVVTGVSLVASTSNRGSLDPLYKVSVKCKDAQGQYFAREEVVHPKNLIFKNGCDVTLKTSARDGVGGDTVVERKARVIGFYYLMEACDRVREGGLRYILQEVGGRRKLHQRVHPQSVSYRNPNLEEMGEVEGVQHSVISKTEVGAPVNENGIHCAVKDPQRQDTRMEQVPTCISVPPDRKDEISNASIGTNMTPPGYLRQREDHQSKMRSNFESNRRHTSELENVKEKIHHVEDYSTYSNTNNVSANLNSSLPGQAAINRKKGGSNMIKREGHVEHKIINFTKRCDFSESNHSDQKSVESLHDNTDTGIKEPPQQHYFNTHNKPQQMSNSLRDENTFIDAPLKSSYSSPSQKSSSTNYEETEKMEDISRNSVIKENCFMYRLCLPLTFDEVSHFLFGRYYDNIINQTKCFSYFLDNGQDIPTVVILGETCDIVGQTALHILNFLKRMANLGKNRLKHIIIERKYIVKKNAGKDKDDVIDVERLSSHDHNCVKDTYRRDDQIETRGNLPCRSEKNSHKRKKHCSNIMNEQASRNGKQAKYEEIEYKMLLPISKVRAFGIVIGDKGVTQKAMLQTTHCKTIQLMKSGPNHSFIVIKSDKRSSADCAVIKILEALGDAGLSERFLQSITITPKWCDFHRTGSHSTNECKERKRRLKMMSHVDDG